MKRSGLRLVIALMMVVTLMSLATPATSNAAQSSNLYLPMVVTSTNLATPGTPEEDQGSELYLPDEVVVKLLQATDLAGIASDFALDPTPLDQFGSRAIYRMRILDGAAAPDRAAALAADPRVNYAEPNFLGQAPEGRQQVSWAKGGDDGEYATQWAADTIRLPEAHTITRGAGAVVAVLDTGVDAAHPELAGRLVSGYDFVDLDADPGEVGAHDLNVVYGHGTHVAGLIALVAPEARIMPVRVLDPDGVGNIWVLAEALAYAVNPDGDLNTDDGADIINLSLSTLRHTDLLAEIVAAVTCGNGDDDDDDGDDDKDCLARPPGAVVVAAAGNSGSNVPEYPAAEGVAGSISVGASTPAETLASFSNFGPWVRVAAPGQNILSSIPGGEYGVWSGTSMAAPLAAGEAALLRAAHPDLDPSAVVQRIVATSAAIGGPVPLRIDVAAALGLPAAGAPAGGDVTCTGALGAVKVDNLRVPPGQTCNLTGTRVQGSVKVEGAATLNARGIDVIGNLKGESAASINISNSTIGGSVQIVQGGLSQLSMSAVKGDVQYFKNSGGIAITGNTIGGNLQCKENHPAAPTGGGNSVQGKTEDQCVGL